MDLFRELFYEEFDSGYFQRRAHHNEEVGFLAKIVRDVVRDEVTVWVVFVVKDNIRAKGADCDGASVCGDTNFVFFGAKRAIGCVTFFECVQVELGGCGPQ